MKSIQTRFVVLMIVIGSSLLATFGLLNYLDSRSEKNKQLDAHLQAIQLRLQQSLPPALWRFDREQIQQILDAEIGAEAILGLAVYDDKDRLLHIAATDMDREVFPDLRSMPAHLDDTTVVREFALHMNADGGHELLGTVRVHASSSAIQQALQREALRMLALIFLMNLVIVVSLCAIMQMVIMRPLNALRNALRDIATEGADLSMRLPPSEWQEFADVIEHFNAFAARLEAALGAPIDQVHQTINRIAQGNLSQPVELSAHVSGNTVIARLAHMQESLLKLTSQLREAKQQADAASQAKTDFLANMSHEIRTPLNAILGMTRLAMRSDLPAPQRVQLGKVLHSAQHLLWLINDILDFSKIEAGKLSLEHVPFELADVIDNVVTLVGEKALDKGLELVVDVDASVPTHWQGDPLRLSQIVLNFATNAVKFTSQGEVVIYVRLLERQGDEARLLIGVRDTGMGIEPEQQAGLFQSFYQAHSEQLQPHGGTGLGLAIARRLSQLMRGDVGMESVPHRGSDFWCEVALQVVPAQPLALPDMASQTALVIDDHALAALVLERMLQEAGLRTRRVNSGTAALGLVQQEALHFDWIFADRNMPGMDGVATLSALVQQLPVRPRHLVLLNHNLSETSFSAGLPAGTEILTKPLTAKAVQQLLHAQFTSELPAPTTTRALRSEGLQASAGARVLVVEDIEINREVALGLLEDLGIGLIVDFADNGRQALEQLARHDYAAVFMDMHMPELDGIAATRAIRQNPRWDGIPIIAMTANHLESDIQRCMQAGMCDFVTKPIDPQRLREAVQRWVKPATQASSSAPAPAPVRPIVQALQSVTGLAVERGLDHFGGKQATYREMLRQFIVEHASTAQQAAKAYAQGHVAHAATVLQTLISQAHAVGAELMAEHATQLLQHLQSPSTSAPVTAPDWDALEQLHAQLHEQVKAAMARSFPQHHFL